MEIKESSASIADILSPIHLICMPEERGFSGRIKNGLVNSERTSIVYNIDKGTIEINSQTYDVGRPSFSEVAHAVLDSLRELYGDYETIPYTFNSEAYENERFKAEVLALGGQGLLEFSVYKK